MVNQNLIQRMENYAKENNVPIMNSEGIEFLTKYVEDNNIKTILELGTAIAYSTILMASIRDDIKITSIERDEVRYKEAVKNVEEAGLTDRITLVFADALEVEINDKYDLIFIDAAKAQNIKFFEKYEKNLEKDGTIITDNMKFHGLVDLDNSQIESRNVRQLVRKIRNYHDWLEQNNNYITDFKDIGDGVAITKRQED